MCTYKYKLKRHHLTGETCIYPDFYAENLDAFQSKILPVDSHGLCIFHSEDKSWKAQNNFHEMFDELIRVTLTISEKSNLKWPFNFSGFYFFTSNGLFTLADWEIHYAIDFRFSVFANGLAIEDSTIKSLDFGRCQFHDLVKFTKVDILDNFFSSNAEFDNGLHVSQCSFDSQTYFDDCRFNNPNKRVSNEVKFASSSFKYISFQETTFETQILFRNVTFSGETVFDQCTFHQAVQFEHSEVNEPMNFNGTVFDLPANVNPMFSTVHLSGLTVNKNGRLAFVGDEPHSNMIKGEMRINFKETPAGIIYFENFNLNKIYSEDKERLLELEKTGQVEIGMGCRKYYCQSEIFTITASKPNQKLILDMVNIFCNYFDNHNHYNLGLEIVERKMELIKYFFFTDEKISAEEFKSRIKQNEYDLWDTFANLSNYEHHQLDERLVEENNALIEMAAMFLKIKNRILALDYFEKDLVQLSKSVSVDGTPVVNIKGLFKNLPTAFHDFYRTLPPITFNPPIMQTNYHGPVIQGEITGNSGTVIIGDHNNVKSNNTEYHDLFENRNLSDEQRNEVVLLIEEMRSELDPVKKESAFQKFLKQWIPIFGTGLANLVKPLI